VPKKASYAVVSICVFGRFSVDNRQKLIKKYAFSYENGENKMKILVWSENILLCFH